MVRPTGRRVANRLTTAGLEVRSASRSSQTRFDWTDQATWAPALDGVDAVYITYYPDLAFPGAADTVGAFADLAVAAGARRLVLLSGRGEEGARSAEGRVQSSGADWTIVRCAFFDQDFSEMFVDGVRHGVLAIPGGDTTEPFLDADDIADVVTAALTNDRHIGELYELTGPRLLTLTETAAELSTAIDRTVEYVPVTSGEYAAELITYGLAQEEAVPISELIAQVRGGRRYGRGDVLYLLDVRHQGSGTSRTRAGCCGHASHQQGGANTSVHGTDLRYRSGLCRARRRRGALSR